MGRLNSQTNTKGGNTRYDEEERVRGPETETTKYSDNDKRYKPDKFTNKQKDRNNRSYKSDSINDKPDYKRYNDKYERQHYRTEPSDYDQDGRSGVHGKEYKEQSKPSTKVEETRKRSDGKFDYKTKSKEGRDSARNDDAQKTSAKQEGRQYTSGKDRKDVGRNYNNKPLTPNQYSSKNCESNAASTDGNIDGKDFTGTTTETASISTGSTKEKERSGKSYSSKRRERQQQRNEQ